MITLLRVVISSGVEGTADVVAERCVVGIVVVNGVVVAAGAG